MPINARDAQLLRRFAARLPPTFARRLRDYRQPALLRALRRELRRRPAAAGFDALEGMTAREAQALFFRLLLPVTEFFRDPAAFAALDALLPERPLRVLSAPCAGGEEAWSLAALCAARPARAGSRIFGADLHAPSLLKARAGLYPRRSVAGLTPAQRGLLIDSAAITPSGTVTIHPRLRWMAGFRRLDLLAYFPAGPYDLIACRNLLIYLDAPARRRLVASAMQALAPEGLLFLGGAEGLPQPAGNLGLVSLSPHKIYRWRTAAESVA